jgi:hemerythrin-like domain-containing protein
MVRVGVKYVTGKLREDHDRILEAIQLLHKAIEVKDADAIYNLIEFAKGFIDACHHSAEEYILFPGAVRGGFPYEGSPIEVMVCEHGVGRYLIRSMEELYRAWRAGDQGAFAELVDVARLYSDHITQHIEKENDVLFPMLKGNVEEVDSSRTMEQLERENRHEEWIEALGRLREKLNK